MKTRIQNPEYSIQNETARRRDADSNNRDGRDLQKQRRAEGYENDGIDPVKVAQPALTRFNPHEFFYDQAELGTHVGELMTTRRTGHRNCVKCCGLFGFPSPPRDGCPNGVVRWRETWSRKVRESSDCFTKVRESSRKFAQIRPVNPRLFGLLRVAAYFVEAGDF